MAQRAFLSCHLPHSLAHRGAQLTVTGIDSVVHGNRHSPGRGVVPVVTTSSTAEEVCPVRETYWTGGSSELIREARAVNRYIKEG